MIDAEGFRPNVGIVLMSPMGKVLWAKRQGQEAWQFPQGGIQTGETPEMAVFRELHEEVGLLASDVTVLGSTPGWLRYRLPDRYLRTGVGDNRFVGQKQRWFLLLGQGIDDRVRLDVTATPEFEAWQWVDFWYPIDHVIEFKKEVYQKALEQLEPIRQAFLDGRA
ncbi:MAG: RNA pyrophosphohydrolase [Gammaproteobacteria bacterium]